MSDITSIEGPTRWPTNLTFAEPVSDTPLGDIYSAAARSARLGETIVSEAAAREEVYDRRIEAIRQATGVTLENPERFGYALEARSHLREAMRNGDLSPIDESAGVAPYRRRVFDQKVAELQAKHPDLQFGGIDEEAQALSTEARQDLERAWLQPGNAFLKWGAAAAGGMAGRIQARDPLFLGALFAGPATSVGRTALAKIATSALGQGVFNAGLTGGEQYALQDWLAKTGQPTGVGPAVEQMGGAFVGGAGLGAIGGALGEALKAAAPSIRRLLRGQPEPGDIKIATEALAPKPAAPAIAPEDIVAGAQSLPERAMRAGEDSLAADKAVLTEKPPSPAIEANPSKAFPEATLTSRGELSLPLAEGKGAVDFSVGPTEVKMGTVHLEEAEQGKGIASAAYRRIIDWALATGRTVRSNGAPRPGAARIYESLERRGYDVERITNKAGNTEYAVKGGPTSPLHDDLVAAALKRADDPEAPSPEAVAAIQQITAFHGTPHDFAAFDMKFGEGEGAQKFGPGLYFAESQKVAENYSKSTSYAHFIRTVKGLYDEFDSPQDAHDALNATNELTKSQKELVSALEEDDFLGFEYPHQAVAAAIKEGRNFEMSDRTKQAIKNLGHLYQVNIRADRGMMIDWDKGLRGQSPQVDAALKRFAILATEENGATPQSAFMARDGDVSMDDFRKQLEYDFDPYTAARLLKESGIPGIQYFDQASRRSGEGTRNFVVFDHNDVEITHKNGEPVQKPIDPELQDRIEQANPRNPREAMAAADQALDDFGRRDGMAALQEKIQALKQARDAETEEWRGSQEGPGEGDVRSKVPMKDRNNNDVMRDERYVRQDGDTDERTADLIRECK